MFRLYLCTVMIVLLTACGLDEQKPSGAERSEEAPEMKGEETQESWPEIVIENADLRAIEKLSKGDNYTLTVNDTMTFTFKVQSRNEFVKGIQSVSGNLAGNDIGTVTLSVQQDTLNGAIIWPGKDWYYALYMDKNTGEHVISRQKQDQLEGSESMSIEN